MGIMMGADKIPEKWLEPIGHGIKTVAVNPISLFLPETIEELTERVIQAAIQNTVHFIDLPAITSEPTSISEEVKANLGVLTPEVRHDLWERRSNEITFDLPYAKLAVIYEDGAAVRTGDTFKLTFHLSSLPYNNQVMHGTLVLPEGWSSSAPGIILRQVCGDTTISITAGAFTKNIMYIPMELQLSGRMAPVRIYIPIQFAEGTRLDCRALEVLPEDNIFATHDWRKARHEAIVNK